MHAEFACLKTRDEIVYSGAAPSISNWVELETVHVIVTSAGPTMVRLKELEMLFKLNTSRLSKNIFKIIYPLKEVYNTTDIDGRFSIRRIFIFQK